MIMINEVRSLQSSEETPNFRGLSEAGKLLVSSQCALERLSDWLADRSESDDQDCKISPPKRASKRCIMPPTFLNFMSNHRIRGFQAAKYEKVQKYIFRKPTSLPKHMGLKKMKIDVHLIELDALVIAFSL